MTDNGLVVARIANTPGEAKVLVALLQAEGIPAHVDGESLADEVAMSRRAMNLNGVRVLVPGSHLELAKEVLASTAVPEAELEAQALASAGEAGAEHEVAPRARTSSRLPAFALAATTLLALVFFALWRGDREARGRGQNPNFTYGGSAHHILEDRRSDGRLYREMFDENADGNFEKMVVHCRDGAVMTYLDADEDGKHERATIQHPDGSLEELSDPEGNGRFEFVIVRDRDGKEVRRQQWRGASGFVDVPR